jgi:hypothetical protein
MPPAHFPTPLQRLGPAATSTEVPGPRAEGKDRTFTTRPQSPDKGHHEGDRGHERMSYRVDTARGRDYAWPVRHSVDRKVALSWNIEGSSMPAHYRTDEMETTCTPTYFFES